MNLHTNLDLTRNHQNSTPNPAQKPEKTREKVVETTKITKNSSKNPAVKPHKNGLIDMY